MEADYLKLEKKQGNECATSPPRELVRRTRYYFDLQNPKVSIIVPVYNREACLRQCLESIVDQTLREIEIILVDDGSTDSSSAICDEYASQDSRVHVIHKQNEGMGIAYNTGIAVSRGEYIGFVETDDWIEREMYGVLFATAVEHDVDVLKSLYTEIKDGVPPRVCNKFSLGTLNKRITNKFQIREFTTGCVSHWSAIYRRQFILDEHILFPCTPGASYQDVGFNWQVFVKMRSCYILPLSFYNYQASNPTSSVNQGYRSAEMIFRMQLWIDEWSMRENSSDKLEERRKKNVFIELYYRCIVNKTRCRGLRKLRFTLKASKLFSKCLPGLQFTMFSPNDRKEYLRICKHPYFHFFWSCIYERKSSGEQTFCKICGINLYERKGKVGKIHYRLLGIPCGKKVEKGNLSVRYFIGIPYASVERRGNVIIKRFFGIRYKVVNATES